MGYNSVADRQYGSIFIRIVLLPRKHEKCREIPRKFDLTAVQSSKVIDLGVNEKPVCDFLLVIFSRVCYRFRDIQA